ncbi:hypothetical protein [Mesorhizobium australicum]|uniref:hypothetical protein n=1 Tax=Mesorhizobium australicum TaxID=536018 RepID=UPI00333AE1C2
MSSSARLVDLDEQIRSLRQKHRLLTIERETLCAEAHDQRDAFRRAYDEIMAVLEDAREARAIAWHRRAAARQTSANAPYVPETEKAR